MNFWMLFEMAHDHTSSVLMCFVDAVDFKTAFDAVSQEKLRIKMLEMGYLHAK